MIHNHIVIFCSNTCDVFTRERGNRPNTSTRPHQPFLHSRFYATESGLSDLLPPRKEGDDEREWKRSLPPIMASSRTPPLLLLSFLFFFFLAVSATAGEDDAALETEKPDSPLLEVEQLKSKISALESRIVHHKKELERKDESLVEVEKLIKGKSDVILSLQKEIETIQKKGAVDVAELLKQTETQSATLEKQIDKLKRELEMQRQNKDALEAHATGAEKKIEELTSKLNTLQRTNDEQKWRIQKTERLLKVAEEELMKAKLEASSKKKELEEIHGAWLPSWLATHLDCYMEYTVTQWNHHGKPAMDDILQKGFKILVQVQEHAKPHLQTVNDKLLPSLKKQWITFLAFIEPHFQRMSTVAVEYYEASLTTLRPHVLRMQEVANPYFQEARKFSKPYMNQVADVTKPHVEKVRVALKPYTKNAVRTYGKFLEFATTYHYQVQAFTREKLKQYELTKTLATKELVWFLASVFLALPIYLLYIIGAPFFCKKPRKQTQFSPESSTPRRHKRRHT